MKKWFNVFFIVLDVVAVAVVFYGKQRQYERLKCVGTDPRTSSRARGLDATVRRFW
jgi:hypothetical protein